MSATLLTWIFCCGVPDYSIWIRNYALYLEERLQCFTVMNYDVATNTSVSNLVQIIFISFWV